MKNKNSKPCCGSCASFENEDTHGIGWCAKKKKNRQCDDKYCRKYCKKLLKNAATFKTTGL